MPASHHGQPIHPNDGVPTDFGAAAGRQDSGCRAKAKAKAKVPNKPNNSLLGCERERERERGELACLGLHVADAVCRGHVPCSAVPRSCKRRNQTRVIHRPFLPLHGPPFCNLGMKRPVWPASGLVLDWARSLICKCLPTNVTPWSRGFSAC